MTPFLILWFISPFVWCGPWRFDWSKHFLIHHLLPFSGSDVSSQSNILIDDEGKARLCDFGLSSIAADFQSTSHLTSTIGGNVRWAAPELYHIYEDDSTPSVTTYSDIYSFGSVMLEVQIKHHFGFQKLVLIVMNRCSQATSPIRTSSVTHKSSSKYTKEWNPEGLPLHSLPTNFGRSSTCVGMMNLPAGLILLKYRNLCRNFYMEIDDIPLDFLLVVLFSLGLVVCLGWNGPALHRQWLNFVSLLDLVDLCGRLTSCTPM